MSKAQTDPVIRPIDAHMDLITATVFSSERNIKQPDIALPSQLKLNTRLKMGGEDLLAKIPPTSIPCVFFDPQYRGVLDHLNYGNEGVKRGRKRSELVQMSDKVIRSFITLIDRVLIGTGHLFLWVDKFHMAQGISNWITGTSLDIVDFIAWNKDKMGMGYRTRRYSEYLVVLQKEPRKAKGVWKVHNIPDIWTEKVKGNNGVHPKPVGLQGELIDAVTNGGDIIVDPAAGSFSVMTACEIRGRHFLGCDLNG